MGMPIISSERPVVTQSVQPSPPSTAVDAPAVSSMDSLRFDEAQPAQTRPAQPAVEVEVEALASVQEADVVDAPNVEVLTKPKRAATTGSVTQPIGKSTTVSPTRAKVPTSARIEKREADPGRWILLVLIIVALGVWLTTR